MKKILSMAVVLVMVLSMGLVASAATGITAEEQKLLDAAKAKAVELGVDTKSSKEYASYMAQATTFLQETDMTAEQITTMNKAIEDSAAEAKKTMTEKGATSLKDLDVSTFTALKNDIVSQVTKTSKKVGITIAADGNGFSVSSNGVTVGSNNAVIKQTGADLTTSVLVAVMVLGAAAACVVVASRKKNVEA